MGPRDNQMIDAEGFRPNVGIIITDGRGRVLWARRHRQDSWQFPQGGIHSGETPEDAMFRELYEEVGLNRQAVKILGVTRGWLRYRLPKRLLRHDAKPLCIGQKQRWFLLQLVAPESAIEFNVTDHPEFDHWQWVNYWYPLRHVVSFKREVYRRALKELLSLLFSGAAPVQEAQPSGPRPPRERERRRRPRRERRGNAPRNESPRSDSPRGEPPRNEPRQP